MNYLVLDTETTNSIEEPMTYDIGWSIYNANGDTLKEVSFVVAEIFTDKDLMASAFFSDKIPQYEADILSGERILAPIALIRTALRADCLGYNISAISAHNATFDYRSCTKSIRYVTKSAIRYFLPYGVEIWDTLTMAKEVFGNDENYIDFCVKNGFCCKNGKPRMTAEILYRYLTNDTNFVESHTGLEDTKIEKEILFECLKRKPDCRKSPWKD